MYSVPTNRIARAVLALTGCFALGSVGFFLAVVTMQPSARAVAPSPKQLLATQMQKDAALQSLALSEASSTPPDVATKLQILAHLNAQ
jgi:hypothetical protein